MTIGDRIHAVRKQRGLTLKELSELCGSSPSYIWEIENSKHPDPSARKLDAIAQALGVTSDWLLNGDGPAESAEDLAFYRTYLAQDDKTRRRIRLTAAVMID